MCGYVWEVGYNLNYYISIVCKFGSMLIKHYTKITKSKLIPKKFRVTFPFTTLLPIKTEWWVAIGRKELWRNGIRFNELCFFQIQIRVTKRVIGEKRKEKVILEHMEDKFLPRHLRIQFYLRVLTNRSRL